MDFAANIEKVREVKLDAIIWFFDNAQPVYISSVGGIGVR